MPTIHKTTVKFFDGSQVVIRATGYPRDSIAGSFVSVRIGAGMELALPMSVDEARTLAAILEEAAAEASRPSAVTARQITAGDLGVAHEAFIR